VSLQLTTDHRPLPVANARRPTSRLAFIRRVR